MQKRTLTLALALCAGTMAAGASTALANPLAQWNGRVIIEASRRGDTTAYDRGFKQGWREGERDGRQSRRFQATVENRSDRRWDAYENGYADGYRAGYERGRPADVVVRGGRGYQEPASARGYSDGYQLGLDDARDRDRYDPVRDKDYREGDNGYYREYGPKDAYKDNYRAGFRQGYEDGYRIVVGRR